LFGVLLNVGSRNLDPNGRGRIFRDFTFEYLPLPEIEETIENVPTYRQLGFRHVQFPDLPVHLDPEFETFTYGHVRRGFGDIESLLRLKGKSVLFFYANLQKGNKWFPYVIGFFKNPRIYDCRKLSIKEILALRTIGFAENTHLKRVNPSVHMLIKGDKGSQLLKKAFPLAEKDKPLTLQKGLRSSVHTATGKIIRPRTPWFRWTLICNSSELLHKVLEWQRRKSILQQKKSYLERFIFS
jgi:hypothetical protein